MRKESAAQLVAPLAIAPFKAAGSISSVSGPPQALVAPAPKIMIGFELMGLAIDSSAWAVDNAALAAGWFRALLMSRFARVP